MKKMVQVGAVAAAVAVGLSFNVQAVDFPAADADGTVTLTEAGTYGATIPAGTSKLVVDANGDVTLSAASTGFIGPVEILKDSTLFVTHKDAVSKASSVTVKNGGTFHPNFAGPGQFAQIFTMPIYIEGEGNNGVGAFEFTSPGSDCPDSAVSQLILTGDATIRCDKRWGLSNGKTIDLQGHTLTRRGAGNFMFITANITPGNFVNYDGDLTFQSNQGDFGMTGDATNTVFTFKSGQAVLWTCGKAVPYALVFEGGWFRAGSGAGKPPFNTFSGPVTVKKWITAAYDSDKSVAFTGPIKMQDVIHLQNGSSGKSAGTLYVSGKATGAKSFQSCAGGLIVMNATEVGNPALTMQSGSIEVDCTSGNLDMLRVGNGGSSWGVLHHVNGKLGFGSWDNPRIGESTGSYGAYVFENGAMYPSNTFYLAVDQANAHGVFLQKGGLFELRHAKPGEGTAYFRAGNANTEAVFVQTGGTNDTRLATSQRLNFRLGEGGGSNYMFTVTGSNTLFRTDTFYWGSKTVATKAVIALNDGATFTANRFRTEPSHPAASDVTLSFDGGIMCPTLAWGWNGVNGGTADFYASAPEHVVVFGKGATFDTSSSGLADASDIPLAFAAPEGEGIKSIAFPTDGGFSATAYKGPVPVQIEGPAGSYGAAAYADYDFANKKLSKIVVTSPGCNYDSSTKIYLQNPTCGARFLCPSFELTGEQIGGGLTKRGAKGLNVWAKCTHTGGTTVESGALTMRQGIPDNTPVKVLKGASLYANGSKVRVSRLAGQGLLDSTGVTVTESLDVDASAFADGATPLTMSTYGSVTFADGAKVNLTLGAQQLLDLKGKGMVKVLVSPAGIDGTMPQLLVNGQVDADWRLVLSSDRKTMKVGSPRGLSVIVK